MELSDTAGLVAQTEGASPAFLRELVRKAALFAEVGGDGPVGERHFREALDEMEEGGRLTRSILGAGTEGVSAAAPPTGFPRAGSPPTGSC